MTLRELRAIPTVYTHAGRFHADDVFSTAFVQLIHPNVNVIRTLQVPADSFAYDIGRGKFDHHQEDAEVRPNKIRYAGFGLLWREFAPEFLNSQYLADLIDAEFVQKIDDSDNGGPDNPMSYMIAQLNPIWDMNENIDNAFWTAVNLAKQFLSRLIQSKVGAERARPIVNQAQRTHDNRVLWLPCECPWYDKVDPKTEYVVYPSKRGGLSIECVPIKQGVREYKRKFPVTWRGKSAQDLNNLCPGLTFTHRSGFLAAVVDQGTAYRVLDYIFANEFNTTLFS